MNKKLKIKIICGFRKDQQYTIGVDEAHKAYYLFLHPDERGIFSTGLALTGRQIQSIEPDYNASVGWNPDHVMNGDDWNEIRAKGIDTELRDIMYVAKSVSQTATQLQINRPMSEMKLLTSGESEEDREEILLRVARKNCTKCENKGMVIIQKNGEWVAARCECVKEVYKLLS